MSAADANFDEWKSDERLAPFLCNFFHHRAISFGAGELGAQLATRRREHHAHFGAGGEGSVGACSFAFAQSQLTRLGIDSMWKLMAANEQITSLTLDGFVLPHLPSPASRIGGLIHLEHLALTRWARLRELPTELGDLGHLETLDLSHCATLRELPPSLHRLGRLRTLLVHDCQGLRGLPTPEAAPVGRGTTGGGSPMLRSLTCLDLTNAPRLSPRRLERLPWRACERLAACHLGERDPATYPSHSADGQSARGARAALGTALGESPRSLANSLDSVPAALCTLTSLEALHLVNLASLQALPPLPERLRVLDLSGCAQLRPVEGCLPMTAPPAHVGAGGRKLPALRRLSLERCAALFAGVTTLDLAGFASLEVCAAHTLEDSSAGLFLTLTRTHPILMLTRTHPILTPRPPPSLTPQELPEGVAEMRSLNEVRLSGCEALTAAALTTALVSMRPRRPGLGASDGASADEKGVERLWLDGCTRLQVELLELDLTSWIALEALPQGLGELTNLRVLDCSGCVQLTCLPDAIGRLGLLRELHCRRCLRLRTLPDAICDLRRLEALDVASCAALLRLPEEV